MKIDFISSKCSEEKSLMHFKSNKRRSMNDIDKDEIVVETFG